MDMSVEDVLESSIVILPMYLGHKHENPPERNPYKHAKASKVGRLLANPHTSKTDRPDPTVESEIHQRRS